MPTTLPPQPPTPCLLPPHTLPACPPHTCLLPHHTLPPASHTCLSLPTLPPPPTPCASASPPCLLRSHIPASSSTHPASCLTHPCLPVLPPPCSCIQTLPPASMPPTPASCLPHLLSCPHTCLPLPHPGFLPSTPCFLPPTTLLLPPTPCFLPPPHLPPDIPHPASCHTITLPPASHTHTQPTTQPRHSPVKYYIIAIQIPISKMWTCLLRALAHTLTPRPFLKDKEFLLAQREKGQAGRFRCARYGKKLKESVCRNESSLSRKPFNRRPKGEEMVELESSRLSHQVQPTLPNYIDFSSTPGSLLHQKKRLR
ncbi:hypothetical protein GWK47_009361 [Chionoecetes opilio]|uniref:Uncharacterized protein n=1 Tax=Chionoecetes opilio TaxID=41210 RepID=A0A8J5CNM9_CHIOP|nr:hypothetical protein GWK47_009361 [Chionoecetes opilio]